MIRPKEFVWAYPHEPPFTLDAKPMKNAPAVDDQGCLYFCTQGRLLAIVEEHDKPTIVWEYVTGSHSPGPVVIGPDGVLRVHTADGLLHAVSTSGKQAWAPVSVGEPLGWAGPVLDEVGNTYISAYDGGLLRVNAQGKPQAGAYFRSRRKLDSTGVVLDGVLLIGSEDGYVFAIRLDSDKGTNTWDHAIDAGYTGGFVNSSPAVSDDAGTIVFAARDGTLFGFAPGGATAWSVKLPGQLLGSPVIDTHGQIYVGLGQARRGRRASGGLVCVDGASHKIRWQYEAAAPVESTPLIGDDETIYFGDDSGTIHALNTRGQSQWTAKVEAAVRSAGTLIAPGRIAFALDDDTLVVLKCSSQRLPERGWPKILRNPGQSGLLG